MNQAVANLLKSILPEDVVGEVLKYGVGVHPAAEDAAKNARGRLWQHALKDMVLCDLECFRVEEDDPHPNPTDVAASHICASADLLICQQCVERRGFVVDEEWFDGYG